MTNDTTHTCTAEQSRGMSSPYPAKGLRRGPLTFVFIFIISTSALLVGYRYAIGTPVMNWYLFQVARHTAWFLDTVGYSATLEPGNFAGREDEVRAQSAAWEQGTSLMRIGALSSYARGPLSPWEKWRYRYQRFDRERALDQQQLAQLEPLPPRVVRGSDEYEAALRQAVQRFEKGLERPGLAEGTVMFAPQAVIRDFRRLKTDLEGVIDGHPEGDAPVEEVLDGISARLNDLHKQQVAFLEAEVAKKDRQLRDDFGPLILYVARRGVDTEVRELRARLADVLRDSLLDEDSRHTKAAALRAEMARLRDAQDAGRRTRALEEEVSFRFNVIPDCGAIPSMAILFSALIAFPAPWTRRFLGIAIGIPVLYMVNTIRLGCLAIIGAWDKGGEWFEFSHRFGWQGIYVIFVVVVWLLWIQFVMKHRGRP